jgi:hypothetical protein
MLYTSMQMVLSMRSSWPTILLPSPYSLRVEVVDSGTFVLVLAINTHSLNTSLVPSQRDDKSNSACRNSLTHLLLAPLRRPAWRARCHFNHSRSLRPNRCG